MPSRKIYLLSCASGSNYDFKCGVDCCNMYGIFHSVFKYNLLLCVINIVLNYFPESIQEINCKYHFLIYTTLSYGTLAKIIKKLLELNKKPVSSKDIDSKTCFHLLIDRYEILNIDLVTKFICHIMFIEVINLIYKVEISLIIKKDNICRSIISYV